MQRAWIWDAPDGAREGGDEEHEATGAVAPGGDQGDQGDAEGRVELWDELPHVVRRVAASMKQVGGPVTEPRISGASVVFTAMLGTNLALVEVGPDLSRGRPAVRVRLESVRGFKLVLAQFPLVFLLSLVVAVTLHPEGAWWLWGGGVGLVLGTLGLVYGTRWVRSPPREGTRAYARMEAQLERVSRAMDRVCQDLGLVAHACEVRILGLDDDGARALTGETGEDALRMGDVAAWAQLLDTALAEVTHTS